MKNSTDKDRNIARFCLVGIIVLFFIRGGFGNIDRPLVSLIAIGIPWYIYLLLLPIVACVLHWTLRFLAYIVGFED